MNSVEIAHKALNGKWPERIDLRLSIDIGYVLSLSGDRLIPIHGGNDIYRNQFEALGVN